MQNCLSLKDSNLFKVNFCAWAELGGNRNVGRDHMGDLGVAAGCLAACHQKNRLTVCRNLDISLPNGFG